MDFIEIPLKEIQEAPFNYNLHPQNQVDELCKSLEEFGQFKNIVMWQGYCIAGNGLVFAAKQLEWNSLQAVIRDDLSEEQAKRLCLTDNAIPYLAQPDTQKLDKLLQELPSVDDIPGITDDWLKKHTEKYQKISTPKTYELPRPIQKIHFLISIPSAQYHLYHEKMQAFIDSADCEVLQNGN